MCNNTNKAPGNSADESWKQAEALERARKPLPKGELICEDRQKLEKLIFDQFEPGFVQKTEK